MQADYKALFHQRFLFSINSIYCESKTPPVSHPQFDSPASLIVHYRVSQENQRSAGFSPNVPHGTRHDGPDEAVSPASVHLVSFSTRKGSLITVSLQDIEKLQLIR